MTSDKKSVSLLADIFVKKGLSDIVISPGSRNAPLIISFANQPGVRALSVVDERSAAFFALGMAQQTGKTVAIACTSGSAVLNYAPAIAEAYYQKIPLLVLTADRPPELIDMGDGQTIRQKEVYRNYVKESFELLCEEDDQAGMMMNEDTINRAIDLTMYPEPGPVHINIPLREPLYGTTEEQPDGKVFDARMTIYGPDKLLLEELVATWKKSEKILLIAGQMLPDLQLNKYLSELAGRENVAVLTETTSNLNSERFADCIDNIISTIGEEEADTFQPELLVTFGGQVVSKMLKKFLRQHRPVNHWHISPSGEKMDTYFSLNEIVAMQPAEFFRIVMGISDARSSGYASTWSSRKKQVEEKRDAYLKTIPYSDLQVFDVLLNEIPDDTLLHLGNSTPVRYSQLFGSKPKFVYHSNRGVSGIDGQVSTAAGAAFVSDKINTIITGDLGFLYDSNALMNHNLTPNLKIIVINNGGGGIFRFIPGPDTSPQLETFFEARHNWRAKKIAEAFDVAYFKAETLQELKKVLPAFYKNNFSRPALLEIFTPAETNAKVLKEYFKVLK